MKVIEIFLKRVDGFLFATISDFFLQIKCDLLLSIYYLIRFGIGVILSLANINFSFIKTKETNTERCK